MQKLVPVTPALVRERQKKSFWELANQNRKFQGHWATVSQIIIIIMIIIIIIDIIFSVVVIMYQFILLIMWIIYININNTN